MCNWYNYQSQEVLRTNDNCLQNLAPIQKARRVDLAKDHNNWFYRGRLLLGIDRRPAFLRLGFQKNGICLLPR